MLKPVTTAQVPSKPHQHFPSTQDWWSKWGQMILSLLTIPAIVVSCANGPHAGMEKGLTTQAEADSQAKVSVTPPPKDLHTYYHFILGHQAELAKDADGAIDEYLRALGGDRDSIQLQTRLAALYLSTGKLEKAVHFADQVAAENRVTAKTLIEIAAVYAGAGNIEQAVVMYDRAIALEPASHEPYFSKGILFVNQKRYPEAKQAFLQGLERNEGSPLGHFYLGRIGLQTKQWDAAISHFRKTIDLRPTFEAAHIGLATAYESTKEYAQTVEVYEQYLKEVNSNNRDVQQRLVKAYIQMKDYDQALPLLERILAENPHDLDAQLRVSLIYGDQKNYPKAISLLQQILSVRPNEVKIRDYLGLMYEQSDKPQKALQAYRKNLEIEPTFYDGLMHLGFLLYRQKEFDQAIPHLAEAVRLQPTKADPYLLLGLANLQAQYHEKALAAFQEGVRRHPSNADLHFNLGTAYDKLDKFESVVESMETTLRLDPKHADALNYLGYSYADRGIQIDKAVELTKRAVALKPDNGYYIDSLGWAFFKMGRLDDALKEINRAISLVGDDPVIFEHLGEIYFKQDRLEQAKDAWRRSLELDPNNQKLRDRLQTLGFGDLYKKEQLSRVEPSDRS